MNMDIICFGALNVDRLYRVNRIAKAEEESIILDFKESPGGSAANTAVGLARLRVKTGYIGKVARDREGELLLKAFKDEEVSTDGIVISKTGRSGVIMGYVDPNGERALYLDPGVNDLIEFNEINIEYVSNTRFLHLTSFAGKKPFESQKKLVGELSNVEVTLDPGEIYARKGWDKLMPLIRRCFAVFPNENELKLLVGKDYKESSEILIDEGVSIVAVKLGKRGCYVTDGRESHLIKPYKVNIVDSTGAGDAFCAGFLYGLIRNKTLKECGLIGNFVASRCIMKLGARDGLPKLVDLPSSFR